MADVNARPSHPMGFEGTQKYMSLLGMDQEECSAILEKFHVRRTVEAIRKAQYSRIALQFPDSLLSEAPGVCAALNQCLGPDHMVFILGDTAYGSCCPDEVAAQHLNADSIVHYGRACLAPARSLPVLYIFPGFDTMLEDEQAEKIRAALKSISEENPGAARIVVLYDVTVRKTVFANAALLNELGDKVELAEPRCSDLDDFILPASEDRGDCCSSENLFEIGALSFKRNVLLKETAVLWFSEQPWDNTALSPAVYNASLVLASGMRESCLAMYSYCLNNDELTAINGWRGFRKRVREVERVREAQRIGVIAGTLAVADGNETIERLVSVIEESGKRAYVMLVGRLNVPKLLNFEEIDAFVLVSCAERALHFQGEINVPFLTPFELIAALNDNYSIFDSKYELDLSALGREVDQVSTNPNSEQRVSVRGKWYVSVSDANSASTFFNDRAWKGLEATKGGADGNIDVSNLPTRASEGTSGIASRYDKES